MTKNLHMTRDTKNTLKSIRKVQQRNNNNKIICFYFFLWNRIYFAQKHSLGNVVYIIISPVKFF